MGFPSRDFKDLQVWQKAMRVAREVYILARKFPSEERYALSDQIHRCAVSIPSNIAEGQQRKGRQEFAQFISHAQGSRAELQTQLLLARDFEYMTDEEIEPIFYELEEIGKMLYSLSNAITKN